MAWLQSIAQLCCKLSGSRLRLGASGCPNSLLAAKADNAGPTPTQNSPHSPANPHAALAPVLKPT